MKPTRSARRSAAKRDAALKARRQAQARQTRMNLLGDEETYHEGYREVSHLPTTRLMRHPGSYEHSGSEVAKMLKTGAASVQMRDRDAAGPLRENVGCTVKPLDYRTPPSPDRHRNGF